jgi:diguanylate cyclase (GGDEF)-like protein/PAS domain S-box-containing protein
MLSSLTRALLLALPAVAVACVCVVMQASAIFTVVSVGLAAYLPAAVGFFLGRRQRAAMAGRANDLVEALIDAIPDPIHIKRRGGRYVMVNEAFARYHGISRQEVLSSGLPNRSSDRANHALTLQEDEQILAGAALTKEEHTVRRHTGEEVFRIISKHRSVDIEGEPVVVGIDHHITQWRVAERELTQALQREVELRQHTERFVQDLIDLLPDAIYIKDANSRLVMVNAAAARIRHMSKEELIGLDGRDLAPHADVGDLSMQEDARVLAGEEVVKEEAGVLPVTGEECHRIVLKRRCINVDGSPVVVSIQHYVTEWRLAERELRRLAQEDVLTGIANRRYFSTEAERALHAVERDGQPLSLLLLDLDRFKDINDQYGHNVGDEVLAEMVRRLLQVLRKSDLPGRWGGEEFIVLLRGDAGAALCAAERVRRVVADTPFDTSHGPVVVTLSGGCASYRQGDSLSSLVGRADKGLYAAKRGGRNRIMDASEQPDTRPADLGERRGGGLGAAGSAGSAA